MGPLSCYLSRKADAKLHQKFETTKPFGIFLLQKQKMKVQIALRFGIYILFFVGHLSYFGIT